MDHEMYVTQDLKSTRDMHFLTRATLKKPELTSSQCTWFHYEDLREFTIMKHCTHKFMSTFCPRASISQPQVRTPRYPLGALRLTVTPGGAKSIPTPGRGPQRTSRVRGGPNVLEELEVWGSHGVLLGRPGRIVGLHSEPSHEDQFLRASVASCTR